MSDILERLDKLKTRIQEEDFLKGNGLSNEVNIHIFCYDPADEMAVRYFTEQLISDQSLTSHVIEKNLYKVLLEIPSFLTLISRDLLTKTLQQYYVYLLRCFTTTLVSMEKI